MKLSLVLVASITADVTEAINARWATDNHFERRLAYANIAGYNASSQVADHCAVDLDQKAIKEQLAIKTPESFENAHRIYNEGGHSKSYAQVTLVCPLTFTLYKGDIIIGSNAEGMKVRGKANETYPPGSSVIGIQYDTNDNQEIYLCQVGGLPSDFINLNGCFGSMGDMGVYLGDVDGLAEYSIGYVYDPASDNNNGRTIASFSTRAQDKMRVGCKGCPYTDFLYFYNYYGTDDYADEWITAAFEGRATTFLEGNADFSIYGLDGREQAINKGTVLLNLFMYVIRQLEFALDECNDAAESMIGGNADSNHQWDVGVCYYTGSIEGMDGVANGNLLHQLADKLCTNFKTCSADGGALVGISKLNYDLFDLFAVGNSNLVAGNCDAARESTRMFITKMYIPMIQGAIRYAYKNDKLQGGEKGKAEAAVFAAAVLPRIHAVSPETANTLYKNLRVGASNTNFQEVKRAFESVYSDLRISCSDVGGLWNQFTNAYFEDAEPCIDSISVQGTLPSPSPSRDNLFGQLNAEIISSNKNDNTKVPNAAPSAVPTTLGNDDETDLISDSADKLSFGTLFIVTVLSLALGFV